VFGGVRRLAWIIGFLQLLGLVMLGLILYRTARGQKKLVLAEERKERMDSELKIASAIQTAMLPKVYPPFPDRDELDVFGSLVPAKEVGGDLYDYFLRNGTLLFCIGDVSGKGIPASLVMMVTRSLFRTLSAREETPDGTVTALNQALSEKNENNMFVTFFMGMLDLRTGLLRYCNAGHNPPLVASADGTASFLPLSTNVPVGVVPDMSFEGGEIRLHPGDTIFLYTDGLTEAENGAQELFGEDATLRALREAAPLDARAQVEHMAAAVHAHVDEADQSDDLTMLSVKYLGHSVEAKDLRRLRLHNDVREIPRLADFVEEVAAGTSLGMADVMSLNLALEEAVTNVIMYAYPSGTDGLVDIEAAHTDGWLSFTVTDSGKPFDPTAAQPVDTSLPAEERPVGGLGIHLVRQIMDEVSYARIDDRNVLTLRKKV
jgi:sigma-B regulation protein RsbU (phosphoserine phosphatase)